MKHPGVKEKGGKDASKKKSWGSYHHPLRTPNINVKEKGKDFSGSKGGAVLPL